MKEKGPLIAIAGIGIVILLATFLMQIKTMKKLKAIAVPKGAQVGEAQEMGPLFDFGDPVTVNLADVESHYVRVHLVFEIVAEPSEKKKKGEETGSTYEKQVKEREPALRDAVIKVLRAKRFAELKDPIAQDRLKKEILKAIDKIVGKHKIRAVYFKEFVIE